MCNTLILGYGNTLRGDDGAGALAAEAIAAQALPSVDVRVLHQLLPELAAPIAAADLVIFIDAAVGTAGQVQCEPVVPAVGLPVLSHRCSPGQLLGLVASTLQRPSPPAWTVSVAGHGFELGAPLHPTTAQAVETAWSMLLAQLNRCGVTLPDITTTPPIGSANA